MDTAINAPAKPAADMTGTDLVVRRHLLDFVANERSLPLRTHDDAVLSDWYDKEAVPGMGNTSMRHLPLPIRNA